MNSDLTITRSQKTEINPSEMRDATHKKCFHCGEDLPSKGIEYLEIDGHRQPMCCSGCKAVAQYIVDAGLQDYYQHRRELPQKVKETSLLSTTDWQAFDKLSPNKQSTSDVSEVLLDIEGMHCVSCAWLVQNKIEESGDVNLVSLDHQTGIAVIRWQKSKLALSKILHSINALGYLPHVLEQDGSGELEQELGALRSENSLKRLAVAGLGMMQVMMFAVALYTGDAMNMESVYRRFFIWVSMLVTFPVLFYSGMPFLRHAWQSARLGRMHMDIPISIALLSAFVLSVINSFFGSGEVYFDSVVMFVFFLSVSRYIQERITRRMISSRQAFSRMLPVLVDVEEQVTNEGTNSVRIIKKPAGELLEGEVIAIPVGGVIPADGRILSGHTEIDAAWLSGESKPVLYKQGEEVYAGMINLSNPIQVLVTSDAKQSAVSILSQRLRRSKYTNLEQKSFASRYVTYFVSFTLMLASGVFIYWYLHNDWRYGFEIALAVLVVSCPCALAIAMPSSVASLTKYLHDIGIYVINPDKLINLSRISSVILDKTGTLTDPIPDLEHGGNIDSTVDHLAYARALSGLTQHPKARFLQSRKNDIKVSDVEEISGSGISGEINGKRYYLGKQTFAAENSFKKNAYLYFGDGQNSLLQWSMRDRLRNDAPGLIDQLHNEEHRTILCSGDQHSAVKNIADQLHINKFYAEQSGEQKLSLIQSLQVKGETVLSIGDGVNDAEFLQQADLSISFTNASELAQANADILIADQDLSKIKVLLGSASRLKKIYRQNLTWAITYNFIMLPLAVLGYVQPWIAALGMSISSLFVVVNSLRLSQKHADKANATRAGLA